MLYLSKSLPLLALCIVNDVNAQATMAPYTGSVGNTTIAGNGSMIGSDGKYTISSEGIRANFVPYGASISNLFINDTHGVERDIVLGWDNATYYTEDLQHPHFGGVPGRYANRIKNSTFTIDGQDYHITPNENNGEDTLHGGLRGWDWRNWTITAHTTDSITFSLVDPDMDQGFPGEVISYVTYTVSPYSWHLRMVAIPTTKKTPIMLSSHTYWNLDAFQNPSTDLILNHTLNLPYSGQYIDIDNIEIPTGNINAIQPYSVNDFWTSRKQFGANITSPALLGNCGYNCTGYDNAYLINRDAGGPYDWRMKGPVATLASAWSGIQVDVFTDQDAYQVYSCNGMNGSVALKQTQGLFGNDSRPRTVPKYGCIVMEVEDWIDGINQPEWGRGAKQIFEPGGDPYVLNARYDFSVMDSKQGNNMGYGGMAKRDSPKLY